MFELQIADIEFSMPEQDFKNAFQEQIDNYSDHMNYQIKTLRTKYGNTMYKISVDNGNNSSIDIVAEQDVVTGDVHFHPVKLANFNESFYSVHYDDDIAGSSADPCMFICYALRNICIEQKGNFAYVDPNGDTVLIKEGSHKRGATLAIVDDDGAVYSSYGAKSVKAASENISFEVKKPIAEWLQENPNVAAAIQTLSLDQKMNYIGKYLIQLRTNDEIDAEEFMDVFCQAGLIGFTDKTVANIYKLLM